MNAIQKSLLMNALFSSTSGALLLLFNRPVAKIFGTPNSVPFLIIGAVLLFFSATIFFEIKKQRPVSILWIIAQDFLWVTASIIIVVTNYFEVSKVGNTSIAAVAFIVLFMGVNQSKALAQVDSIDNKNTKHFRFERVVKAPKHKVWEVISDVANYHEVAPNIDDVKIISGEGQGLVRSCSHGAESWTETCTLWDEEKSYSFEVNTAAPDYPYPFRYLKGTWEVQELDSNTTKIIMLFDFRYKHKYQNWLLHPLLRNKFKKTANELLENWQVLLEK